MSQPDLMGVYQKDDNVSGPVLTWTQKNPERGYSLFYNSTSIMRDIDTL